jgi:hypothetical protein
LGGIVWSRVAVGIAASGRPASTRTGVDHPGSTRESVDDEKLWRREAPSRGNADEGKQVAFGYIGTLDGSFKGANSGPAGSGSTGNPRFSAPGTK